MTIALICAIIGLCVVYGVCRVARATGAHERNNEEFQETFEMFYPKREERFYAQRKWEVKVD